MESLRFSQNEEYLHPGSAIKLKVQYELFEYIISYLEDHLEGFHEHLDPQDAHNNPYAEFVIESVSELYATWFESFTDQEVTSGQKKRRPVKAEDFQRNYEGKPENVLQEVVGHRGYSTPEQYLRELEEWFKVKQRQKQPQEIKRDSILAVRMTAHLTSKAANGVVAKLNADSA